VISTAVLSASAAGDPLGACASRQSRHCCVSRISTAIADHYENLTAKSIRITTASQSRRADIAMLRIPDGVVENVKRGRDVHGSREEFVCLFPAVVSNRCVRVSNSEIALLMLIDLLT
jgi:hypothetical protein